ncbi:hypothetical protein PanWU01x14_246700, partial [Parasponia andersonii]
DQHGKQFERQSFDPMIEESDNQTLALCKGLSNSFFLQDSIDRDMSRPNDQLFPEILGEIMTTSLRELAIRVHDVDMEEGSRLRPPMGQRKEKESPKLHALTHPFHFLKGWIRPRRPYGSNFAPLNGEALKATKEFYNSLPTETSFCPHASFDFNLEVVMTGS